MRLLMTGLALSLTIACSGGDDDKTDTESDPVSDTETESDDATDTDATDTESSDTESSDTESSDTESSDTETSDTETSDTEVEYENMLANGDFESGWDGKSWLIYPAELTNYDIVSTGDTLYNSKETFTAYEGDNSLKLYGQWSGYENETPAYQEFTTKEGMEYAMSAMVWMHSDDPLTAEHTYGNISIKFFDSSWNMIDSASASGLTSSDSTNTWTELSVSGTAPAGAVVVQAALEFWQCEDTTDPGNCWDGNGAVYFDDVTFYTVSE